MPNEKYTTVDEYINTFPSETREILQKIREMIRKLAPRALELISYQIPAYKLGKGYYIYFSGWKDHISLYPVPKGSDESMEKITPFRTGKGTLQFKLDQPIPYGIIENVIAEHLKNVKSPAEGEEFYAA